LTPLPQDLDRVDWHHLRHAYGPADDVPDRIRGLRGPDARECLSWLYGSITHQGTRYTSTAWCVPFLVDAAFDRDVEDRSGVIFLVQFCALGYSGDVLDWPRQRDSQIPPEERAAWDAVVAEHPRLRLLLADSDPRVASAALTTLAWTGDDDEEVLAFIGRAIRNGGDLDACTAWLCTAVLGVLPPGVTAPATLSPRRPATRFGEAVAALRLGGSRAPVEAVEELCAIFDSVDAGDHLKGCDFFAGEDREWVARAALAQVPRHLRERTSELLLEASSRGFVLGSDPLDAYLHLHVGAPYRQIDRADLSAEAVAALRRLGPALRVWERDSPHQPINPLIEFGLPSTSESLLRWLDGRPGPNPTAPQL